LIGISITIKRVLLIAVFLTIVGIMRGIIYLKYGIGTAIIAHYVYNTVIIGIPLLRSQNLHFLISGMIEILMIVILGKQLRKKML